MGVFAIVKNCLSQPFHNHSCGAYWKQSLFGQEKLLARSRAKQSLFRRKQAEIFLNMSLIVHKILQAILSDLCHGHHVLRRQNFSSRPEWIEQGAWDMANMRLKVKACDANESLQLFLFVSGHLLKSEL